MDIYIKKTKSCIKTDQQSLNIHTICSKIDVSNSLKLHHQIKPKKKKNNNNITAFYPIVSLHAR